MINLYANDFSEILDVLKKNELLRKRVLNLIESGNIIGKSTEGGDRLEKFRIILKQLVEEIIKDISEAYVNVEKLLPRNASSFASNNSVFSDDWAERLVRTQLSRFYNQAVMEELLEKKEIKCFVSHSKSENIDTNCTKFLAGNEVDLKQLYERLVNAYEKGDYSNKEPKIPDHPNCTHVVKPIK